MHQSCVIVALLCATFLNLTICASILRNCWATLRYFFNCCATISCSCCIALVISRICFIEFQQQHLVNLSKKNATDFQQQYLGNFVNKKRHSASGLPLAHPSLLPGGRRKGRQAAGQEAECLWPLSPLYLVRPPWDDLSSWQDKSSSQKGWVSIDRSVVAALPSTTPWPVHKSSTDDLGPPLCHVSDQESGPHF